jgi:hypothetical protein
MSVECEVRCINGIVVCSQVWSKGEKGRATVSRRPIGESIKVTHES